MKPVAIHGNHEIIHTGVDAFRLWVVARGAQGDEERHEVVFGGVGLCRIGCCLPIVDQSRKICVM